VLSSSLFLRQDGDLVALSEQPYDREEVLQRLLAEHPELIPGEALNPNDPRRFVLVRREAPVAGLKLDHLFLDQEAIPTLVETKRADNRETRREVVAQMLDYAASASAEWTADKLAEWLAERCAAASLSAETLLSDLDHEFEDDESFWAQAEQNLRDGKVRLLFVTDKVPTSLQRIVEFLNERMTPTEVLAAEVRQYVSDDDKQLLTTGLVGQTEKAREIKGQSKQPPVLNALVDGGHLKDGDEVWLLPSALPAAVRPDNADPRLRFTLKVSGGQYRLMYQPNGDGELEEWTASKGPDRVHQVLDPDFTGMRPRAVNNAYAKEPGGKSLGEVALEQGLWTEQ